MLYHFPTRHGGDLDALDDIEINTDGDRNRVD